MRGIKTDVCRQIVNTEFHRNALLPKQHKIIQQPNKITGVHALLL
jgi:hypothetical protein